MGMGKEQCTRCKKFLYSGDNCECLDLEEEARRELQTYLDERGEE